MTTLTLETEPVAVDVQMTDETFVVTLVDGRAFSIPLGWYPRLLHGTVEERLHWQLLGDGYAIEWPDLDEHVGIEGLIAGRRSSESEKSIQRWLATREQ